MRVLFSKGLVFVSKPRCGSTSIRKHLLPYISKEDGDIAVDEADQVKIFHPHDTAPYIKAKLAELYPLHPKLTFLMTTRNPVDMLWSYFRFFKPDSNSNYNYQSTWNEYSKMDFEHWIQFGSVGMNPAWQELAPSWISTDNLSPLSLEAHAIDRAGNNHIDNLFRLENTTELNRWLSHRLENRRFPALSEVFQTRSLMAFPRVRTSQKPLPHINQSEGTGETEKDEVPLALSEISLKAIRMMFPMESRMYNI